MARAYSMNGFDQTIGGLPLGMPPSRRCPGTRHCFWLCGCSRWECSTAGAIGEIGGIGGIRPGKAFKLGDLLDTAQRVEHLHEMHGLSERGCRRSDKGNVKGGRKVRRQPRPDHPDHESAQPATVEARGDFVSGEWFGPCGCGGAENTVGGNRVGCVRVGKIKPIPRRATRPGRARSSRLLPASPEGSRVCSGCASP